jgi:hypothetical protein
LDGIDFGFLYKFFLKKSYGRIRDCLNSAEGANVEFFQIVFYFFMDFLSFFLKRKREITKERKKREIEQILCPHRGTTKESTLEKSMRSCLRQRSLHFPFPIHFLLSPGGRINDSLFLSRKICDNYLIYVK